MKDIFLLMKYYREYIRYDKLTYKLLSKPASEQDADLLDEYIQTRDFYAECIREIKERRARRHPVLKKAVSYIAVVLAIILVGTGIAEAAGFSIWREVFSFGSKNIIIQGTDDEYDSDNAELVYVDSANDAKSYKYGSLSAANAAVGADTHLSDDMIAGFSSEPPTVTYVGDISYLDVTYKSGETYITIRVTVVQDGSFFTGIAVQQEGYSEKEIAGIICSVNKKDGVQSCIFRMNTDDAGFMYSVRTNADDETLVEIVRKIAG